MDLPWPLSGERTSQLVESVPAPAEPSAVVAQRPPGRRVALALARRASHSSAGRRLAASARSAAARLLAEEVARERVVDGDIHDLQVQLQRLERAPSWYQEGLRRDTNLDLLKAEVRALERTLLELGMQLAPGTGLAGVGERVGELREQVNAVARHTRQLDAAVRHLDAGESASAPEPSPVAPAPDTLDVLFDYVAFEQRFRGSPEAILRTQQERYADLLAAHEPVLDWGCGRGELLELLAQRGVDVMGVEIDSGMVSEARSRGLTVHQQDAVSFMSTCEPESLGAVFSAHVAEHIPFEALLEVIHTSLRALRPGGVFVAETPNPMSLIVPSNSFILDPTHLRPIHPSLFAFACETAGFRDVRLTFHAPATGYQVEPLAEDGTEAVGRLNTVIERLNEVVFGPQEYTVVATKA